MALRRWKELLLAVVAAAVLAPAQGQESGLLPSLLEIQAVPYNFRFANSYNMHNAPLPFRPPPGAAVHPTKPGISGEPDLGFPTPMNSPVAPQDKAMTGMRFQSTRIQASPAVSRPQDLPASTFAGLEAALPTQRNPGLPGNRGSLPPAPEFSTFGMAGRQNQERFRQTSVPPNFMFPTAYHTHNQPLPFHPPPEYWEMMKERGHHQELSKDTGGSLRFRATSEQTAGATQIPEGSTEPVDTVGIYRAPQQPSFPVDSFYRPYTFDSFRRPPFAGAPGRLFPE